jgi:hypothetical protein
MNAFVLKLLFIIFLFVGCKSKKEPILKVEKAFIEVDNYTGIDLYSSFSNRNDEYIFCYDSKLKIIRVFSLSKGILVKIIPVPSLFKKETDEEIRTLYVHNFDSIFIGSIYYFRILDSSSQNRYSYIFRYPNTDTFPSKAYCEFSSLFRLHYEPIKNNLMVRQYKGNAFLYDTSFYKSPLEAEFNINKKTFSELPVFFPHKYFSNYYGDLNSVSREIVGDSHIYSFNSDDTIYVYSLLNNTTKKIPCRSSFKKTNTMPLPNQYKDDVNRKIEHILQSPYYLNILYDKFRNCYYRFFLNNMNLKRADGSYNSIADKEQILMVLDANFQITKEIKLPRNSLLSFSFVGKKGLYIRSSQKLNQRQIDSLKANNKNLVNAENPSFFSFDLYEFNSK